MLGHQISRVARPEHFGEFDITAELLLLEPWQADVEVPYSPNSLSLEYAERCGRVDM